MESLKSMLNRRSLLANIAVPSEVDALLTALQIQDPEPAGSPAEGTVTLGVDTALGFFALNLDPPGPPIGFRLEEGLPDARFRIWLKLSEATPAKKLFSFAAGVPGAVLKAATPAASADQEWLEPAAGDVSIEGAGVYLLIEGRDGGTASMRLSPTIGMPRGIVELRLDPPDVLLGSTGFGFSFPEGFVIDESADAAPSGQTMIAGAPIATACDTLAWRGLAARRALFYFPRGVPFIGGHAVDAFVEIGHDPTPGIDIAIHTKVPPKDDRPGIEVLIECHDPTATGLQQFIPSLVEAAMELKIPPEEQNVNGVGGVKFAAGTPVVARVRFSRSAADPETTITLGLEAQGPDGIVSVTTPNGGLASKVVVAAGALATALIADDPPPGADASGVVLHALLTAALGISAFLQDKGSLVVHKVELSSTGHGLPVGGAVVLKLDYSVDVLVKPINVGVLSVSMSDIQPMRVRNRNVGLTINPDAAGLDKFKLDFSKADMEIEDPGKWKVQSLDSIFDILGSRSGRGSIWLEVDLRFKLNLGPVKVSGATIRATLLTDGSISASLRGLDASLDVAGVIQAEGQFQLSEPDGFAAELDAKVLPLNINANAKVLYTPRDDSFLLFLRLGVDLPAPIPIANTGIGLFGLAGSFGVNARPRLPDPANPIDSAIKWDSSDPATAFDFAQGDQTVGAEAVLATLPDFGFSFSTRGGLFITVPDVAVRGALWGKVLQPHLLISDRPAPEAIGASFKGTVIADANDGITIGLKGELRVPIVLEAIIPIGARFPFKDPGDWYVYVGTDGYSNPVRPDGRTLGPVRAIALPDIIPQSADAYFMVRGRGIDKWPRGGPITIVEGLVVAAGFHFDYTIGLKPVVWADVHMGADVLLAVCPTMLAGFGQVGGSLNLGPFSVGVDAKLDLLIAENADPYVRVQLCGHIDLFFTDIEGCVSISINNPPPLEIPIPDTHPLDRISNSAIAGDTAYLIDDQYRRIADLSRTKEKAPTVWPDTLIQFGFAVSPKLPEKFGDPQFTGIEAYPSGLAAERIGSEMLNYHWLLNAISLTNVTNGEPGVEVTGPLTGAWQVGKDGDLGVRPQPGDLVLLTWMSDVWLNALADAGAGLPDNPLQNAGKLCRQEVAPRMGWAVGWGALPTATGFHLPCDPLNADQMVARFTVELRPGFSGLPDVVLGPLSAWRLPLPASFVPAALVPATPFIDTPDRSFDGVLQLGAVVAPEGALTYRRVGIQTAQLTPSEPLLAGDLWLAIIADKPDDENLVAVRDERGAWIRHLAVDAGDGRTKFVQFVPGAAGPFHTVTISWVMTVRIGVLGLGGITAPAVAAAQARNAATAAAAQRNADAKTKQPQLYKEITGSGTRCVLEPGQTYRIDIDMQWIAEWFKQDESGKKVSAGTVTTTDLKSRSYKPKGGGNPSTSRTYYFRTAEKPTPGVPATVKYGEVVGVAGGLKLTYAEHIYRRQDLFEPEMLTRLLAGYEPAQSETFRFCDDPVKVHFRAAHAASLADAYGYKLNAGLRRVDVPGTDGDPIPLTASWVAMTKSQYLKGTDKVRFEIAATSPCPLPTPGATLIAQPPPLTTLAWYEVYTALSANDPAHVADARLDGVTFQTSRWHNPTEMLGALAFPVAGPRGAASGDIEITALPVFDPAVVEGEDAAFEAALDKLGLDGWHTPPEVRTSIIWLKKNDPAGPSWLCAGVFVESPEPIHRPGRAEIASFSLQMPLSPGITFDIRRRDRIGSRLLYLTSTPFKPKQRVISGHSVLLPEFQLVIQDLKESVSLTGRLRLAPAPSFAAEA